LLSVFSCNGGKSDDPVLAKVGAHEINLTEFRMFLFLNAGQSRYYSSLKDLEKPLNELIERKLKIIDATEYGLGNDEGIGKRVESLERNALYHYTLEKEVYEKSIPDSLVERHYATTCEARKIRHIFLSTGEDEKILNQNMALLDSLKVCLQEEGDFAAIASRFSQYAPSAVNGGDLGYQCWGEEAGLGADFYSAAFAQKIGEVGGPIKSNKGLHLIKVEDVRDLNQPVFDEVKHLIRPNFVRMRSSETRKFYDDFRTEVGEHYKLEFDDGNIAFLVGKVNEIRARYPGRPMGARLTELLSEQDLDRELFNFSRKKYTIADFAMSPKGIQNANNPPIYESVERAKEYFAELIPEEEFVIAWGYEREYERHEIMKTARRRNFEDEMIREIERVRIHEKMGKPPADELLDYYERHRSDYMSAKQYEIREILVADGTFARELAARIQAGADFTPLAVQYSRSRSLLLSPGEPFSVSESQTPELASCAARLQIGEISDLIETEFGFSVIKLMAVEPERVREFSRIKGKVEADFVISEIKKRRQEWLSELKAQTTVEIYEDVLLPLFFN
jgi:parvulin-like peptidyl-prolyl isomerase